MQNSLLVIFDKIQCRGNLVKILQQLLLLLLSLLLLLLLLLLLPLVLSLSLPSQCRLAQKTLSLLSQQPTCRIY